MIDVQTVNDIFEIATSRGDETVAMWNNRGSWEPISSKMLYGRVRAVVQKLQSWGIQRGDRIALIGENRWEWAVTDFAALAMGAVDVPMYQTLTPDQIGFMLRNSGARAVFVSTKDQYEKVVKAGEIPSLEHIVVFDNGDLPNAVNFASLVENSSELEAHDPAFDALVKQTKPEDLASIIYTSGTTGDPKGVMLTHGNMGSNLRHSTDGFHIRKGDKSISFLPLSHVTARHLDYALYGLKAVIAYVPSFNDLPKAMKALKPEIFLAVPRVYEKIRQAVEHKSTGFKKAILKWALARGKANRKALIAGRTPGSPFWKLAHKLVYSKIAEAFGGNARIFIAGGAPLGMDTINWFLDAGIRIMEGYGLTETSPVISRNTFESYRAGTVGVMVPNIETRIAEDGELEVHGPGVFKAYWQNDEATREAFTADGWFKTGDIGKIEDGFLSITDRKKELIKTSGGKFVAPAPIENRLKSNTLVGQAALIGDQKKFISVLISPNFEALKTWAGANGVTATDNESLVKDAKVNAEYKSIVKQANSSLAHFEAIKRIGIVPEEWSVETSELTPSMKLKRRIILDKYKDRIAAFYKEDSAD
jgi:long-chain acyl-CoA synthetase